MIFDIILFYVYFLIMYVFSMIFLNYEYFDNVNCYIMIIVLIEFNHISYGLVRLRLFL